MDGSGTVERIFIAPEGAADVQERPQIEALAGAGLRGDRYCRGTETGTFVRWEEDEERPAGYDITLIEQEAIEAIKREAGVELAPGEHRRNVETLDAALNHLVGKEFRLGDVICRGDRLCEPCDHLQNLTEDGVLDALVHRGGLRADIIEGGTIRTGDEITPLD